MITMMVKYVYWLIDLGWVCLWQCTGVRPLGDLNSDGVVSVRKQEHRFRLYISRIASWKEKKNLCFFFPLPPPLSPCSSSADDRCSYDYQQGHLRHRPHFARGDDFHRPRRQQLDRCQGNSIKARNVFIYSFYYLFLVLRCVWLVGLSLLVQDILVIIELIINP